MTSRRDFLKVSAAACTGLVFARVATAGPGTVQETDPTAVALGYKANAKGVDKAKFPKYVAGQACANCMFYQGGAAANGACPIFGGKIVSAKGWCGSYAKKA